MSPKKGDNIGNDPLKASKEDMEPIRDDSYDEDINDFEVDSTKGDKNAVGAGKAPLFSRSSKSKANLHKNASLANMKKNRRTSSLIKDQPENPHNAQFTIRSKSKQKTGMKKSLIRGSLNQNSATKFPAMRNGKMHQSYNNTKYRAQFGSAGKLGLRGIK